MRDIPPGDMVDNVIALKAKDMPETKKPDWSELLSTLARTQDKQLFIQLFRHFAPRIKGYIVRLGLTEGTAEELTQETMLLMWRKAHLFNPAKAAASTWIYTLARNQSIDWMRKQKYPEYDIDSWLGEEGEPVEESGAEQSIISDRVAVAIHQLPENQAQVIYMSFYEGRTHSEIADRLSIPLGSVKSRIRLAAEKLKLTLGGEYEY
ncbi:MAG: sigma-70 family RNA polymerase sigma factor [Gammaproteobacteria bacterium]|nr:MAG: sigma-70 family RNA polymerase sigma factor [Gammaproteobacteria bacterium]